MKKLLLLFILMLSFFNGKTQTSIYHPFPDSNAVWNIHYGMYCFSNGTGNENYSIMFSGDTTINKMTYHKLKIPFVQSFSTGTCKGNKASYQGAIRQDIKNRKVFIVPPKDSIEQLLYDFNLKKGDTLKGYLASFSSKNVDTVKSTDSVLVGSGYRKIWYLSNCYGMNLIEGIGSTYGLIQFSPKCMTDLADYNITCFIENGKSLYPDAKANCRIITGLENTITESNFFKISPNPFHNSTILELRKGHENSEIKIYNVLGNLISTEKILGRNSILLQRKDLPNGIYFLQIINEDGSIISKKIVVD